MILKGILYFEEYKNEMKWTFKIACISHTRQSQKHVIYIYIEPYVTYEYGQNLSTQTQQ
jgi:flagellar assembly factor FliW